MFYCCKSALSQQIHLVAVILQEKVIDCKIKHRTKTIFRTGASFYLRCEPLQQVVCRGSGSLDWWELVLGLRSEWRTRCGEDLCELRVLSTLSAAGICSSLPFDCELRRRASGSVEGVTWLVWGWKSQHLRSGRTAMEPRRITAADFCSLFHVSLLPSLLFSVLHTSDWLKVIKTT